MIIDATNLILGRLATFVAKKAMQGEEVVIVNCEKAIITGSRENVLAKFKQKRDRGIPLKGPYYPKLPDRIVRRTIRGMLPYKQYKGKEAFKKVKCFIGVPAEFNSQDSLKVENAQLTRLSNPKFVYVGDIAKLIGGRWHNV